MQLRKAKVTFINQICCRIYPEKSESEKGKKEEKVEKWDGSSNTAVKLRKTFFYVFEVKKKKEKEENKREEKTYNLSPLGNNRT